MNTSIIIPSQICIIIVFRYFFFSFSAEASVSVAPVSLLPCRLPYLPAKEIHTRMRINCHYKETFLIYN